MYHESAVWYNVVFLFYYFIAFNMFLPLQNLGFLVIQLHIVNQKISLLFQNLQGHDCTDKAEIIFSSMIHCIYLYLTLASYYSPAV